MRWKKRTAFGRKQFIGSKRSRTKAMKSILKRDTKNVLNLYKERKELFNTIKKYQVGRGKVTNEGLRMALTELKYDHSNSLSKKEVKTLVEELGVKGKMNKTTLLNSQKFLKKKRDRLKKKFQRTKKHTKEMKFFLPELALGEIVAPVDQFMYKDNENESVAKDSIFRQNLRSYKFNRINDKKVTKNSFSIFGKKNKIAKINKKIGKNYGQKDSQNHSTILKKKTHGFEKEIGSGTHEKKHSLLVERDKTKEKHRLAVAKKKEAYKNRYRIDFEGKKDEYKSRYRTKRKEEALEKIDRYINKDKKEIEESIKGVDKYRQRYLNKKEEEREKYRIDIEKQREDYKDRYRIKKKKDILEKKYKRANKDKIDNKKKNNFNKEDGDTSRIESNLIGTSDYRGKGVREVKITKESLKYTFEKGDDTKSKEKDADRKKNKKKEIILKDIDNFVKQIEFSSAPHREYINSKNKLNYIEIYTIKKKL